MAFVILTDAQGAPTRCYDTVTQQTVPWSLCKQRGGRVMFPGNKDTGMQPRALDYAWNCDANGNLKCYNTHGSTNQGEWTVVHNPENCQGTYVPTCGKTAFKKPGTSGPTAYQSVSAFRHTTSGIYDYIIKYAKKGNVQYYGVVVDGDDDVFTPISAAEYIAFTGNPDVYSTDGTWRFYKTKKKFGRALASYIRLIGHQRNYSEATINKAISLIPAREMMLAQIDRMQIPVADLNDIFEISMKYLKHNEITGHLISDKDHNLAVNAHVSRRNINKLDVGGIISGIVDTIAGLITAGTQAETGQLLNQYINNYLHYMEVDFAEIERTFQESGARAALEHLLAYKNGSWKELTDFMYKFVNDKGIQMPAQITGAIAAQKDLEASIRAAIAQGGPAPGPGTMPGSGNQYSPGGVTHSGAGATPMAAGSFSMTTWMMIAAGIILIVVLMR